MASTHVLLRNKTRATVYEQAKSCDGEAVGKQMNMANDDDKLISVSELARMVRLSRASIQYYEKIGVLNPKCADERHRYSIRDSARLTNAIALKNLGVELDQIVPLLDDEPFSQRHLNEYRKVIAQRRAYLDAQDTMLERYLDLLDNGAVIREQYVEAVLYKGTVPWSPQDGTAEAGEEPLYVPLSGLGGVFGGDDHADPSSFTGGRAVFSRFAPLISGFDDTLPQLGGCTCLTRAWNIPGIIAGQFEPRTWQDLFAELRAYMQKNGLRATGHAFVPYGLSLYGVPQVLVCLPVRRAGVLEQAGRMLTRAIKGGPGAQEG